MIAELTKDVDTITDILNDDDIFDAIAEDGCTKGEFIPDVTCEIWVKITVDDLVIGVCNFHVINSITIKAHIHILKKYRREHSLTAANKLYKWLMEYSRFLKLIVEVPSCHTNVLNYCKAIGFRTEGLNRLSYLKNGQVLDQVQLGITRNEVEDFLNE